MSNKAIKITGWVLTGVLALLFIMSAFMKISMGATGLEKAAELGIAPGVFRVIGIVELAAITLFVIPRTGVVGALLLIAYMGGTIAVHVLEGQPLGMVVVIESLIWIAAALRFPELARRLFSGNQEAVQFHKAV